MTIIIVTIFAIFTFTITSSVSFRRTFSYHTHVSFSYIPKNAVHTNPNRTYIKTGIFMKPHMIANALTIKAASVITAHTSISTRCSLSVFRLLSVTISILSSIYNFILSIGQNSIFIYEFHCHVPTALPITTYFAFFISF